MEMERRFLTLESNDIELRKAEDGAIGIRGKGAVIGPLSVDLGGFRERNSEGAFDDAIEASDIRGLFNHDANYVLGRMGRTMKVSADSRGMFYDIAELPASRADVAEAIERGDVTGSSYSFTLKEGGARYDEEDGVLIRTILPGGVSRIFDMGPVTFPAFPDATVSKRCEDVIREFLGETDYRHLLDLRRRRMDLSVAEGL